MILWCAFCQRYQGEKAPFEDFSLSHGMCAACEAANAHDDPGIGARVAPIREIYDHLRTAARAGDGGAMAVELLDGGQKLELEGASNPGIYGAGFERSVRRLAGLQP